MRRLERGVADEREQPSSPRRGDQRLGVVAPERQLAMFVGAALEREQGGEHTVVVVEHLLAAFSVEVDSRAAVARARLDRLPEHLARVEAPLLDKGERHVADPARGSGLAKSGERGRAGPLPGGMVAAVVADLLDGRDLLIAHRRPDQLLVEQRHDQEVARRRQVARTLGVLERFAAEPDRRGAVPDSRRRLLGHPAQAELPRGHEGSALLDLGDQPKHARDDGGKVRPAVGEVVLREAERHDEVAEVDLDGDDLGAMFRQALADGGVVRQRDAWEVQ